MTSPVDDAINAVMDTIPKVWELGTVTAVSSPTATVDIGGNSITSVRWVVPYGVTAAAVAPAVNDVVLILAARNQRIILGKQS